MSVSEEVKRMIKEVALERAISFLIKDLNNYIKQYLECDKCGNHHTFLVDTCKSCGSIFNGEKNIKPIFYLNLLKP